MCIKKIGTSDVPHSGYARQVLEQQKIVTSRINRDSWQLAATKETAKLNSHFYLLFNAFLKGYWNHCSSFGRFFWLDRNLSWILAAAEVTFQLWKDLENIEDLIIDRDLIKINGSDFDSSEMRFRCDLDLDMIDYQHFMFNRYCIPVPA